MSFIYAIGSEDSQNVKIGISKDPEKRLKHLQTGNSATLQLLAAHRSADPDFSERAAHAIARPFREHGEWFSIGQEYAIRIVEVVAEMPDRIDITEANRDLILERCREHGNRGFTHWFRNILDQVNADREVEDFLPGCDWVTP